MNEPPKDTESSSHEPLQKNPASWLRRAMWFCVALIGTYVLIAYVALPTFWVRYAHRHPAIDETPGITITGDDHPGDPINVAIIGSEEDLKRIMQAAKWFVADPLGLRSDLRIAADTVLGRPYSTAPVSNLFLWGRREDLAFEQPVGDDPRKRHHVRFWKSARVDAEGRPAWMGSATYDKHVGLSHTTGQITHHIAADVDAERDHLFASLSATGQLSDVQAIDNFHNTRNGKNGGGDPWHTDGRLLVGTVTPDHVKSADVSFPSPP